MTDSGDIYLADLGSERRERVLVLSSRRFTSRSGRALVAPGWWGPDLAVQPPWRIPVGDDVFAVDLVLTIRADVLLDHVGQAPYRAVTAARRALVAIT